MRKAEIDPGKYRKQMRRHAFGHGDHHFRNFKSAAEFKDWSRPPCAQWRGRIGDQSSDFHKLSRYLSPGNKTCRLFGAARNRHFRRAANRVNGPIRKSPVSSKGRNARPKATEHVDALASTLARESRHIVASQSSDTTSRAVVTDSLNASVLRKRPSAYLAPGEG